MEPQVLVALKGSIEKWRRIVEEGYIDRGRRDCPLCRIFYDERPYTEVCEGCPVRERTGFIFCRESPYTRYQEMHSMYANDHPKAIEAAKEELEFLRSLLPEGEK